METNSNVAANADPGFQAEDFAERVRANQAKLTSELRPHYEFVVCGSGSSGSVVARRLAENPGVSVLLLEAGGSDVVPSVMQAAQWSANLGSDRDWAFQAQPNPHLNGRSIPLNMGKVLGGGSSIKLPDILAFRDCGSKYRPSQSAKLPGAHPALMSFSMRPSDDLSLA